MCGVGDVIGRSAAVIAVLGWMAALSVVDIRHRRLPNVLTLPGAVVILVVAVACGRGLPAAIGSAALGGAYLVVHLLAPGAMGAGDVKLAVGLGALTAALGAEVWALAAMGAPLVTVVWSAVARARSVPHGPSMCLATLLAVCGTSAVLTAAEVPQIPDLNGGLRLVITPVGRWDACCDGRLPVNPMAVRW